MLGIHIFFAKLYVGPPKPTALARCVAFHDRLDVVTRLDVPNEIIRRYEQCSYARPLPTGFKVARRLRLHW